MFFQKVNEIKNVKRTISYCSKSLNFQSISHIFESVFFTLMIEVSMH